MAKVIEHTSNSCLCTCHAGQGLSRSESDLAATPAAVQTRSKPRLQLLACCRQHFPRPVRCRPAECGAAASRLSNHLGADPRRRSASFGIVPTALGTGSPLASIVAGLSVPLACKRSGWFGARCRRRDRPCSSNALPRLPMCGSASRRHSAVSALNSHRPITPVGMPYGGVSLVVHRRCLGESKFRRPPLNPTPCKSRPTDCGVFTRS